jgi:uncharacterized protein YndB with AHSA1/START domain
MRLPLSNVTESAGNGNSGVSATISTGSPKSGRRPRRRTQEELTMIPTTHEARIVQQFSHPVSLVYQAWTQPKHIEQWLRPAESIRLSVKEFNFREGGEYFFDYVWADGNKPVRGKFLRIVPEKSLIFSWVPQPPDPDAGAETMVSVFFALKARSARKWRCSTRFFRTRRCATATIRAGRVPSLCFLLSFPSANKLTQPPTEK